jgi:uncharacterized protein (DUF342 family)
MAQINGYFQLVRKEDGKYIKLYSSLGEGNAVTYDDIVDYLSMVGVVGYDSNIIREAIMTLFENKVFKLMNTVIAPVKESAKVTVSDDRMSAYIVFYPPSESNLLLSEEDIKSSIIKANIKHGIQAGRISEFMKNRVYNTSIEIAKGMPTVEGKSATIKYYFQTNRSLKPKQNEDGSVDFHQLDMISHVNKGDLLAELIPADTGIPGIDVFGNILRPLKVVNKIMKHGNNIYLSEDGKYMYSNVSGHVELADDKVFVSDTYEVLADVDSSTGDIEYDGNVLIKGNVRTGFTVRAKGDIIVNGVVEGASLISEGQIILKRGIQGMNRGILQAESNIVTKFIESSTVKAGGYVATEAILHSKVYSKGDVIVSGKKGNVTGGEIKSGTLIHLKTAGSTMGTSTNLEVGVNPTLIERYHQLEQDIVKMQEEKDKIVKVLTLFKRKVMQGESIPVEKLQYLQTISQQNQNLDSELVKIVAEYEQMQKQMESNVNGRIIVDNMAYPGVKITISNQMYIIKVTEHHCQFVRDKGDIRALGLN